MAQIYTSESDVAVPTSNAGETAVVTTQGVSPPGRGVPVYINIEGSITTGATVTAIVLRCRRGNGLGGAQVGATVTYNVAANSPVPLSASWNDIPGEVVSQQYTISVQQTGGTSAGSVTQNCTQVAVGNP